MSEREIRISLDLLQDVIPGDAGTFGTLSSGRNGVCGLDIASAGEQARSEV